MSTDFWVRVFFTALPSAFVSGIFFSTTDDSEPYSAPLVIWGCIFGLSLVALFVAFVGIVWTVHTP